MLINENRIIEEASFSPSTESPHTSGGYITKKDADEKFDKINYVLLGIVVVLLFMVTTLIIMTTTLIIDSFRINSAIYKEYSNKIENTEKAKEISNNSLIKIW